MINLIPPIVRKSIITEYWVRVFSIWFFIVAVVATAAVLLSLPVYVLVSSQVNVYEQSALEATQRVNEYDLSAGALVRANVMAQKVFELRGVEKFSTIVTSVEALQGSDIVIEGFNFARTDNTLAPVEVSGRAATRQALADFREALLAQESVSDVILPISNLAKDRDIDFSLSVVFKEVI